MLEMIDTCLEALLRAHVPLSATDVDVSFEAPDKDWAAKLNRPTVNLFLWDVKRSADRSRAGMETIDRNGVMMSRMALPRVEMRYLITAWTSEHRDERALLSGLLRTVLSVPEIPATFVPPELAELTPLRMLLARSGEKNIDVFKSLDGKLKPALDITLVTDIDLGLETPLAAPPSAVGLGVADREQPSRRADLRRVAGEVRFEGASGAVVRSPRASTTVNAAGRFLISAAPGDEVVLELEPPRTAVVPDIGGVVFADVIG